MSGTTTTPITEPYWAKPSIGVYQLTLFMAMIGVVVWLKNDNALLLMVGAVITKAGTVVDYYFGSSSGSATKTAMMNNTPSPPSVI